MRHLSAITLALSALISASTAQAQVTTGQTYTYYLIACGKYMEHRQKGQPVDENNTADMYYIAGWLSAYNRMHPYDGVSEDTTLDDVMFWLEQYCDDHPLSNIEAGLYNLSQEYAKGRHPIQNQPDNNAKP